MTRTLALAALLTMLSAPAFATNSLTTTTSDQQTKKPATSTTVKSEGRTLSDYNIQKE